MTAKITSEQARIMRREFERAISAVRNSVRLSDVESLIRANDIDGLIRLLGLNASTFEPLENSIRDSFRVGGNYTAEILSPIYVDGLGNVAFTFSMQATEATAWLSANAAKLVTEMAEEQQQMIRERLAYFLLKGTGPRTAALDLVGRIDTTTGQRKGGFVGLTSQQAEWVSNARTELETLNPNYLNRGLRDKRLDPVVRKAIEKGESLTAKQIDAAITSLQNRTLKYRGDVISRHESIKALRSGQHLSIMQAVKRGEMDAGDVTKEWDATGDARTREEHLLMEGQTVPLLMPFTFPDGSRAQYPSDDSLGAPASNLIQCRCKIDYRIDFIGRAKRVRGF